MINLLQLSFLGQSAPKTATEIFNKPTTLDGYTPKNKKLLTWPYCFVNVSNNNGSTNSLHYELFHSNDQYSFEIKGVPVPGGSIKCLPINYGNSSIENEDEGLIAGKFPTLSWSEDLYTNWLTQNGVNLSVGISKEILGTSQGNANLSFTEKLANEIAGRGISSIGGALGIRNSMSEVYQHSLSPITARGNTNGGDINTCSNRNVFIFYKMSIKQEYAKSIDDYFTRFGYKINRLKTPNITGRKYWNYVEIGSSEEIGYGEVPSKFMDTINNACRRGVTIWHNHANVGNYTLNNSIV